MIALTPRWLPCREASKAATEAADAAANVEDVIVDRPVACPTRQQMGGSAVSGVSKLSLRTGKTNDQIFLFLIHSLGTAFS